MGKTLRQRVAGKREFKAEYEKNYMEVVKTIAYILVAQENFNNRIIRGDAERLATMRREEKNYCSRLESGCQTLKNLLGKPEVTIGKVMAFQEVECYSGNGIFCGHYQPRTAEVLI